MENKSQHHLKVVIEKAGDKSYGAYIEGISGIGVVGESIDEITTKMAEAIEFYIETAKELGGEIPEELKGEYDLTFSMDAETLLNYYDGVLGKPALEKITGINQKQLWRYASGKVKPRPTRREQINEGLHNLGKELMLVSV